MLGVVVLVVSSMVCLAMVIDWRKNKIREKKRKRKRRREGKKGAMSAKKYQISLENGISTVQLVYC